MADSDMHREDDQLDIEDGNDEVRALLPLDHLPFKNAVFTPLPML